jgi:hypothetical protein
VDIDQGLGNESLRIAREIGDKPLIAEATSWVGNSLYMSGKKQEGVSMALEAVQLARECNDPELLLQTLFTLGILTDDVPVSASQAWAAFWSANGPPTIHWECRVPGVSLPTALSHVL